MDLWMNATSAVAEVGQKNGPLSKRDGKIGMAIALVAILLTMITTGINMLGVSSAWTNFVLGAILLLSLFAGKYLRFNQIKVRKGRVSHGC